MFTRQNMKDECCKALTAYYQPLEPATFVLDWLGESLRAAIDKACHARKDFSDSFGSAECKLIVTEAMNDIGYIINFDKVSDICFSINSIHPGNAKS